MFVAVSLTRVRQENLQHSAWMGLKITDCQRRTLESEELSLKTEIQPWRDVGSAPRKRHWESSTYLKASTSIQTSEWRPKLVSAGIDMSQRHPEVGNNWRRSRAILILCSSATSDLSSKDLCKIKIKKKIDEAPLTFHFLLPCDMSLAHLL